MTEYPFWINDFDRVKNYKDKWPLSTKIFEYPVSFWYLDVGPQVEGSIKRLLKRAETKLPILVVYNIPNRDVGQYSKGGAGSRERYFEYIKTIAKGIGDKSPIVIYEPDALPHSTLLSKEEQDFRLEIMRKGLEILTEWCNGIVYIDVGHSAWLKPKQVVELLNKIDNPKVKGFSVNVCNYRSTKECINWSNRILKYKKDYTYIIDTSRNGNGPKANEWCNPDGRAIGHTPTTNTGIPNCDAFLWIKIPGESDGKCNKGPKAGKFWPEMAEVLIKNSELYND